MSFETVEVVVRTPIGDPLEGVLVKIYDPTGTTFYTQAMTDSSGVADFLLETLSYTMRFYKFQVGFLQPQSFPVLAPPATNVFEVVGEVFIPPVATDPRLCRCSGFFRNLDGSPKQFLDIHFIHQFDPILLDAAAVIADERHLRTDEKGYASIDLIRGAEYAARVEAIDGNWLRDIRVPDLSSCNLPDLLLPVVKRINFSPEGSYSIAKGDTLMVTPTVYDSVGVTLVGSAPYDVKWSSSDPTVLLVEANQNTLTLRGNAVGSAQLLATRRDLSIIKIPDVPILGLPVDVTVT